jgi:hypothetical protein
VKHLEKRLAVVAETLMRLLEKLDALRFEESNKGGRGKRKSLVTKIQVFFLYSLIYKIVTKIQVYYL